MPKNQSWKDIRLSYNMSENELLMMSINIDLRHKINRELFYLFVQKHMFDAS